MDRLLNRSSDSHELLVLPLASEHRMNRCLTWWDLSWLAFGSVVGSGIFVVTGQEARFHAGPAIVLSYAASGFSALLSALCYTEFAVDVPVDEPDSMPADSDKKEIAYAFFPGSSYAGPMKIINTIFSSDLAFSLRREEDLQHSPRTFPFCPH
ncbi:cationic amino acid transporter 8, vacuolar-like [Vigna umbellata]|uniref:cationic amino acid transporter 8, vacuolar-like n=1 Tax=Vigna umbellata TaxID=87088 RepID=UPI001F5F00CA|nr:cationic amino acid transporter 8, vacuolar-like [Vigna umbellata]XP_047149771.1 cationic amino acid transporter 8, vacuolar-like [Vigna umbellata]XP_047179542.1 cationic amino acid transporter 8, vacuolar-like [Vigna umbellata]XP_047179543.1 cationic amino acid transporter 8, vacuolar-like [Vigna umbellata]